MQSYKPVVEFLGIGLASPKTIRRWAEKTLPNGKVVGEVTSPQTVNYKTLKPIKKGLFCERIFGPVDDFICSCGKKPAPNQKFCNECEIEYTSSKVRKFRLGYIELASPVAHIWYFKGRVNYISTLLGMKRRRIDAFLYGTRVTHSIDIFDECRFIGKGATPSEKEKTMPWSCFFTDYNAFFTLPITFPFSWHYDEDGRKFVAFFKAFSEPDDLPLPEYFPYFIQNIIKKKKTANEQIKKDYLLLLKSKKFLSIPISVEKFKRKKFPPLVKKKKETFAGSEVIQSNRQAKPKEIFKRRLRLPGNNRKQKENLALSLPFKKEEVVRDQLPLPFRGVQPFIEIFSCLDLYQLNLILDQKLARINGDLEIWLNPRLPMPGSVDPLDVLFFVKFPTLKLRRVKLLKRMKVVKTFIRTKQKPEWMFLSALPVIPPGLRPILQLDGDQVAISDLNKLYQKILFRNKRLLQESLDNPLYTQRLLQEAVDALIENGKGSSEPVCAANGRPLKSLSDILKGKKGRFRQNLLGKRVDYSGRSVIVVGPKLQIHECGLPKEMAIELFQPFLIRQLVINRVVNTILGAKKLIAEQTLIVWEVLEQLMEGHLVLLNRAPTLHRLGIQAFQPKLVNGRAILLHPLVCTGFNADFDGDQMAVHIPLSYQARAEAWQLMWSRNNILSPATGQPILLPTQDMVLGCYYLTTENYRNQRGAHVESKLKQNPFSTKFYGLLPEGVKPKFTQSNSSNLFFSNFKETILAYAKKKLDIHTFIWVRCDINLETENKNNQPLEMRVDCYGKSLEIYDNTQYFFDFQGKLVSQQVRTTVGRIIFNETLAETFYLDFA